MKNIIKRIRDKRGETLVESMASILIFTFASIIMLTMISTAADINQAAKEADRAHFDLLIEAEMAEGTAKTGTVAFSIGAPSNVSNQSVAVHVYGDAPENGGVYAYYSIDETTATTPTETQPGEHNQQASGG